MGPDEVNNKIFKICAQELCEPVCVLINTTLNTGLVPEQWKEADVIAIYKGGKRELPLNYRPVSLLSTIGKICESLIKDVWMEKMEREGLLNGQQFGFRKGFSTCTNLLSFYARVIDVVDKRNGWVDAVYLDLKKAFDTVPHRELIWK